MSVTSSGRQAPQRTRAMTTSTASNMLSRLSHLRQACERVRRGGATDVSVVARHLRDVVRQQETVRRRPDSVAAWDGHAMSTDLVYLHLVHS
jgi:hypothetical protein